MPDVSSPKRPNNIEPRAYCFACQLMIDYSVKSLGKKKDEADIMEMVDEKNICNYKNYQNEKLQIDFKGVDPRLLTDPCEAILGSYEEELIDTLTHRFDDFKDYTDDMASNMILSMEVQ